MNLSITRYVRNVVAISILCYGTCAHGYDLATHARLTLSAFQASKLQTDPTSLSDLGLPSLTLTKLGTDYYDIAGARASLRSAFPYDFEDLKMPGQKSETRDSAIPVRVSGWLMRGAIREDDGLGLLSGKDQPEDDPDGDINRFCNHFFDPYYHRGYTGSCPGTKLPSSSWAIGSADPFVVPQSAITIDASRRNHFTVQDARESMWRALTGFDADMRTPVASTGKDRKAYWATTFRTLGDVMHLIEDLAQPQHTRDEGHGIGPPKYYESYIDAMAKGTTRQKIQRGTATPVLPTRLTYHGYATVPTPQRLSDLWSTGDRDASLIGTGLADYSSRGFFTPGKNFNTNPYPQPSHSLSDFSPNSIPNDLGFRDEYFSGKVRDTLSGGVDTIRMFRRGVWDQVLGEIAVDAETFSLDEATFDDRARLLLPRATAYAAGFLDYFFNTRLQIELPEQGAYAVLDHSSETAFKVIRLKLRNVSTPLTAADRVAHPQNLLGGTAVAIVKFHRNLCYRDDLSGEYGSSSISQGVAGCRKNVASPDADAFDYDDGAEEIAVSKPLPVPLVLNAGQTISLAFDFSDHSIPLSASDTYLQVVYRGPVGSDTANAEADVVVVTTKDISEPTYFSYFNASDYIHIGTTVMHRNQLRASQQALAKVRPGSCVQGTTGNLDLVEGCLEPFSMSLALGFADMDRPTVRVDNLPQRRYVRFAFLTDSERSAAPGKSKSTSNIPLDRDSVRQKVLLNARTVCLGAGALDIQPVNNQLAYPPIEIDPLYAPEATDVGFVPPPVIATVSFHVDPTTTLRGIEGYLQGSCVLNGDAATLDAVDDRVATMDLIDRNSPESRPYPLVIDDAFLTIR